MAGGLFLVLILGLKLKEPWRIYEKLMIYIYIYVMEISDPQRREFQV